MRRLLILLTLLTVSISAEEIYATFNVKADQNAKLAFSSSGIIDEIMVDVTTEVKKDEVLAKLQNDDLKAQLYITQTALKYAKLDYDRQIKVQSIIDKAKFDQFAFKYENAKAQLRFQQALLDKTSLKAPFDGVIYEKSIEVGDVVSGQMITTVFKIQSKHSRKLILEFDQKYHQFIKIGDSFKYRIDGDTKQYHGKISKIYPYANTKTRKIKAEVLAEDFIVGLFGDGTITTQK